MGFLAAKNVILDVGNVFSLTEKKELFADPKIGDKFVMSVTIESLDDEKNGV